MEIDTKTASVLIQLLESLCKESVDQGVKLLAMEQALQQFPQANIQYAKELAALNKSPAIVANRESRQAAIGKLRAKLDQG